MNPVVSGNLYAACLTIVYYLQFIMSIASMTSFDETKVYNLLNSYRCELTWLRQNPLFIWVWHTVLMVHHDARP